MREDYYRILQVDPTAHPEVVHAAYRTLLRVLAKHPDLGGQDEDARALIEAYRVLGDADRRRTYDLWLKAHSAMAERAVLAPEVGEWVRTTLPDCVVTSEAPFANHFDLVMRTSALAPDLLYVKAAVLRDPRSWPALFTLWRAVRLARSGRWPYGDVILVASTTTEGVEPFVAEAGRPKTRWSLNRCAMAALTFPPPRIQANPGRWTPRLLRRLQAACSTSGPEKAA